MVKRGVHVSVEEQTDVIIVGGGPVGLTASLLLSQMGTDHALYERHQGTSVYPRAVSLNQRTMEVYRGLGLHDELAAHAAPLFCHELTAWYTSLAGPTPLHGRLLGSRNGWGGGQYEAEYAAASPCTYRQLAQIRLEPLLRAHAEAAPHARVHFGAEVVQIDQDDAAVNVVVEQDGARRTVAGKYLIAADGGRTVAKQLDIGVTGPTNLVDMVSVHFTADLSAWHDPKVMITWFINPDLGGSVGTGLLYPIGPWDGSGHSREWNFVFAMGAEDPRRFNEDAARGRLLRTLGIDGLPVTVRNVSHWYIQSVVADSFQAGRCFLAGDAAHRVPPWGALGMNTGIGDVRNLCWKLALALADPALERLLDSYEPERRPVAQAVAANSLTSFHHAVGVIDAALGLTASQSPQDGWRNIEMLWLDHPDGDARRAAMAKAVRSLDLEFHAHGADCGFSYTHGAIQQPPEADSLSDDPITYRATTAPGHHLPHFWTGDAQAGTRATVDLIRPGRFLLLVDQAAERWRRSVGSLDGPLAGAIDVEQLSGAAASPDHPVTWGQLREVRGTGAILVRPDAIVAWRWMDLPGDLNAELGHALGRLAASQP
jgi:2,4-dichlorophenol 6-monooxygenase